MLEIDQTTFDQNLLLTQAYCEEQLKNTHKNFASILRSFNPVYDGKELFTFKFAEYRGENLLIAVWNKDPLEQNLYDEFFDEQLKNKQKTGFLTDSKEYKGNILIAEIDLTVVDGTAEVESGGLIDFYDCPPIDTWFYKTKNESSRVIYAWVPEVFINNINRGIDVNPVASIYWYKEGRTESDNWHNENLGEIQQTIVKENENPPSVFDQLKKMFS